MNYFCDYPVFHWGVTVKKFCQKQGDWKKDKKGDGHTTGGFKPSTHCLSRGKTNSFKITARTLVLK